MSISDFLAKVAELFSNTDPAIITSDSNFWELDEWSSLTALSLVAMIDEEYGVTLKSADIKGVKTLGELYAVVVNRLP